MKNAYIIGFGSLGTALSNVLVQSSRFEIFIYDNNKEILIDVNENNINSRYFPNVKLRTLNFIDSNDIIDGYVFLTLPSKEIDSWISKKSIKISNNSTLINMSKGFDSKGRFIHTLLKSELPSNKIVSIKGPTFADELIRGFPTLITAASDNKEAVLEIKNEFAETNLYIEYCPDYIGVEILSILKNIYSIFIGIIDARYNSANTTFFAFSKSIGEITGLLDFYGGQSKTLLTSAGIGDFGLTALNDLSRNRTFGLFVGKGFYDSSANNKNSVLIEGLRSIKLVFEATQSVNKDFHILTFLHSIFFEGKDFRDLNKLLRKL